MKGQNNIINEILLFMIGMSITAAVIINFQNVQKSANDTIVYSNFNNIANTIINGITEAEKAEKGKVVVKVPDKIASEVYIIKASGDSLVIYSINNPEINVTKNLFKFNISGSHIIYGEVPSTAQYIESVSEKTAFTRLVNVRRAERYA